MKKEDGKKKEDKRITIREEIKKGKDDESLLTRLKIQAAREDRSMNAIVLELIEKYLKEKERKE